jgi:MFS family permease
VLRTAAEGVRRGVLGPVSRAVRRTGTAAHGRLIDLAGGRARTRVIVLLACVLAMASADTATVGASAAELRRALGIDNTDIGLLVTVTSLLAAAFSLPFGMLADRARRTWILAGALLTWGAAMLWSASAGSFTQLLLARLCLGGVTAAAGPTVASLVGDWFAPAERGQIYSYILTGELLGAGVGFAVTGDIAALSWRAAFVILALPAFALAWLVARLPEPARGGHSVLAREPGTRRPAAAAADGSRPEAPADAQRLARERGIPPDPELAARATPRMGLTAAVRYVLAVRTNVALIISGACGYYFLAGVQTFGTEFVGGQYGIGQVAANLLLLIIGAGATLGVLAAGPLGDALLRRGHLNARIMVAAVAATAAVLLFIPALVTHSTLTALPYLVLAAAALSAQNPPIDAARLDVMPPWLWGRAEGVRTFLRTAAQALAPVLFGAVADYVFGGGTTGLKWTFVVMLVPLSGAAGFLYWAARRYPVDVATASVVTERAAN